MIFFDFIPDGAEDCYVQAWIHSYDENEFTQRPRPAVVICPGGAYEMISKREAEPVALQFFANGYNTFILNYSVKEKAKEFKPLCQLASTVLYIRNHADEWMIAKQKIAVCGFSAGGHLAASLGILHNDKLFLSVFGKEADIRPDAMILGYPVITADEYGHVVTLENVSGAKRETKKYKWFGLEQHVNAETSPAFIWHTAEDSIVPVENSLKLSLALANEKIPFELHIFPHGPHGMSVCTKEVENTMIPIVSDYPWVELCVKWMNRLFDFYL